MESMKAAIRQALQGEKLDFFAILLVSLAYLGLFPFFPAMNSANEMSRLYLVEALVVHHDVSIDRPVWQYGFVSDRSQVADSLFSDKPPGTAFLAAPFVALRQMLDGGPDREADIRVARLFVCAIPSLILIMLLRREMLALGVTAPTRALCIAVYGLGTLAFPYSLLFYGHQLTAVLLYSIWYLLRQPISRSRALAIGALASACLSVEYQSAVYLLPLAIAFILRSGLAQICWAVLGASPLLMLTGLYHNAAFGAPWRTGYSYVGNSFFAAVHAQGFLGVKWPRLEPFIQSLFGSSKGLLFFSPFLLLGFIGVPAYAERILEMCEVKRRAIGEIVIRLCMIVLPILFVSSMVYWDGGWTVGQRHLTPLVPFLVAPAAMLIEKRFLCRIIAPGLGTASVIITGLPTVSFPHLPEYYGNPFHDLTLRLVQGGCIGQPVLVAFIAAMFLLLMVAVISTWLDELSIKAGVVVLLVAIPFTYVLATGEINRMRPEDVKERMTTIVHFCKSAGIWEEPRHTNAGSQPHLLR